MYVFISIYIYIYIYIYCSKENHNITCKKLSKKRKLQTFNL